MKLLLLVSGMGLMLSASAVHPWFGAAFGEYGDGEALSDRGVAGGSWGERPAAVSAVKVSDGEDSVIELRGGGMENGVAFTAAEAAGEVSWTVNLRLRFEALVEPEDFTPDGPVAFTLAERVPGENVFIGWAGGVWRFLAADGVSAELNSWYDVRIESRDIGGEEYVGFAIVDAEGALHELKTSNGSRWFAVGRAASAEARTVAFVGSGRFGAFDGARETAEAVAALHWIGGEEGDWNVATNWAATAGGEAVGSCPTTGDVVRVDGAVALTRGEESATVTDFLAKVREDGTLEMLSGTFLTSVALDTSRVRAGKSLEVVSVPFCGLSNPATATWYHAPMTSSGTKGGYEKVSNGVKYAPQKADYESWFKCEYAVEGGPAETKEFFFSKLPVVYMTAEKEPPADKEKVPGTVWTQGNDEFKSPIEGVMAMTINVRGNTTANKNKKPWKLKLDEKTKMFGLGSKSSKHWVLLANAMDPSGYRNKLAYDFANEIGSLAMESTFVSVFLNGTYRGVYQFCQHLRVAEDRVNIYDWESAGEDVAKALVKGAALSDEAKDALKEEMSTNFQWVTSGRVAYGGVTYDLGDYVKGFSSYTNDITGGYLFELDSKSGDELTRFSTATAGNLLSMPVAVSSPETLFTNPTMKDWGKSLLDSFFKATAAVDGYNDGRHFSEIADMNSLVTYYLSMELTGNYDAKNNSRFAYVDRGGPLVFGPVWDCDLAFASPGNSFDEAAKNPERWILLNGKTAFYREWIDDPHFCTLLRECWQKTARQAFADMLEKIKTWNKDLAAPFAADQKRWGTKNVAADRATLVDFITRRLAWIDGQFSADVPTLMASLRTGTGSTYSSTNPYDKEAGDAAMPISFPNAEAGRIPGGKSLQVFVKAAELPADAAATVYLNGIRLQTEFRASGDGLLVKIPSSLLRPESEGSNTIEVIARTADGKTVLARNYGLVVRDPRFVGTLLMVR